MQRRYFIVLSVVGGIAAGLIAMSGRPALALTFENSGGASGTSSGWTDLNYTDPNKKPTSDNEKRKLDSDGPQFKFGPGGAGARPVDPGSYFTPNNLLGR